MASLSTFNWRFRPYAVPENIFMTPFGEATLPSIDFIKQQHQQHEKQQKLNQESKRHYYDSDAGNSNALHKDAMKTLKHWSRSATGLPTPGFEPMAFVFQSSFPTVLQYVVVLGVLSQVAPFIVRNCPINIFPRFIPTTYFTNRNWFLFAHKGT